MAGEQGTSVGIDDNDNIYRLAIYGWSNEYIVPSEKSATLFRGLETKIDLKPVSKP